MTVAETAVSGAICSGSRRADSVVRRRSFLVTTRTTQEQTIKVTATETIRWSTDCSTREASHIGSQAERRPATSHAHSTVRGTTLHLETICKPNSSVRGRPTTTETLSMCGVTQLHLAGVWTMMKNSNLSFVNRNTRLQDLKRVRILQIPAHGITCRRGVVSLRCRLILFVAEWHTTIFGVVPKGAQESTVETLTGGRANGVRPEESGATPTTKGRLYCHVQKTVEVPTTTTVSFALRRDTAYSTRVERLPPKSFTCQSS